MGGRPDTREVNPRLRRISDYAWRLLLIGVVVYVVFRIALRFEPVFVALFLAMVLTALLRPPVNALSRVLPRALAVPTAMLGGIGLVGGVVTLVVFVATSQSTQLSSEFHTGIGRLERWLEGAPFHVKPRTLSNLQNQIGAYLTSHRGTIISQALSGVSKAADVLAILALAVFCSVFFTHSGERMWLWFQAQLPGSAAATWQRCAAAAWRTFAGYTRGAIIVAGANAIMVGVALTLLRVPLALPLTVLAFVASFIPLVGSPIALVVATLVALATRGVPTAIIVLALIVVFGQIEGHVLQPLVMGWSVRLHPVAVAVSVVGGTIAAGLLGAVVAVPLVSIAWSVLRELRSPPPPVTASATAADEPPPTAPTDSAGE